jgi:dihydroneopterin aldolase
MARPDDLRAAKQRSKLFIRDLVLMSNIGVYPQEHLAPQRVRINVEVRVQPPDAPINDDIGNVLSYEDIVTAIKHLIGRGHINLVETLADEIADLCLADARAEEVRVKVEKLDIVPEAASVGVEIERRRARPAPAASIYPLPHVAGSFGGRIDDGKD